MAATKLVRLKEQVAATSRTANDARPRGIHSDLKRGYLTRRDLLCEAKACIVGQGGVRTLNATIFSGQLISVPPAS